MVAMMLTGFNRDAGARPNASATLPADWNYAAQASGGRPVTRNSAGNANVGDALERVSAQMRSRRYRKRDLGLLKICRKRQCNVLSLQTLRQGVPQEDCQFAKRFRENRRRIVGGMVSGRRSGLGRTTGEACRSIDASRLQQEGCLTTGWAGSWEWKLQMAEVMLSRDLFQQILDSIAALRTLPPTRWCGVMHDRSTGPSTGEVHPDAGLERAIRVETANTSPVTWRTARSQTAGIARRREPGLSVIHSPPIGPGIWAISA